MNRFYLLAITLLIWTPAAWGQEGEVRAESAPRVETRIEGDVQVGTVDDDVFMGFFLTGVIRYDALQVALQAPLRVILEDRGAVGDGGGIRSADWDDVEDIVRVLKHLRWSSPGDTFHIHLGELAGVRAGHATVVDRYVNTLSLDMYQPGATVTVHAEEAGGEIFLDNVVDPGLMGARAFIRPLALGEEPDPVLERWTLGVSWAADIDAPRVASAGTSGDVHVVGLDTDWEVFRNDHMSLTPYMDVNLMISDALGWGFHGGMLTRFALSKHSTLSLKAEYQHQGAHYAGQYFDTFYELERVVAPQYIGTAEQRGKLSWLGEQRAARNGGLVQLSTDIEGWVTVAGQFKELTGADNTELTMQVWVPALNRIQLGAVASSRGVDADALFAPESFVMQSVLRIKLVQALDLMGSYQRLWRINADETSAGFGRYEARNDWSVGFGASFEF